MIFALSFFLNAATNFAFGLTLSALLGPAEFGRYSTVQLASLVLASGLLDWLRLSALRFSGEDKDRAVIASSLEAGYFTLTMLAYAVVGVCVLLGASFGLGPALLLMTPLLGIAAHRVDFQGARFRARDEAWPYLGVYGLRQVLCFTAVVAVAWATRNAALTVAALVAANLIPAILYGPRARVEGAALREARRERLKAFFVYAKPIVVSMLVYQVVALVNRHVALVHLGADATGKFSLATDLATRLFGAVNSIFELFLFQLVLRVDRSQGRVAAKRQHEVNISIVLALLAPLAAGYAVMAPTFEALMAPQAYRGDFAVLSEALAPGYFALFALFATVGPVFQLQGGTWQLTAASLVALVVDLALVWLTPLSLNTHGLAVATSASYAAAYVAAIAFAWRVSDIRPRARDLFVIAAATALMAALVRPLNGLSSHALAAAAALAVGGLVLGAAYVAFDVGGARAFVLRRLSGGSALKQVQTVRGVSR